MTELESDIRTRYDIEGFTARHPQAQIFRWVNDAYRELRTRLTVDGSLLFVTLLEVAQTVTGRTAGYPGTLLTTTVGGFSSFQIVHEVHCLFGSSWVPLAERNLMDALTDTDNSSTGSPQGWCLVGLTGESGAAQLGAIALGQETRILIIPTLDSARTFRVIGLKSWEDVTDGTDHLYTDFGLWEYAIRYNGVLLANRDDDVQLWQARKAELQECYQDILRRSKNRTPGRAVRVNTRTRRGR